MLPLCLREKKQEMRLSVSMTQAFPSSFFCPSLFIFFPFFEKLMNSFRLGTTACQARESEEVQHKQQLDKDRLCRPPALDRWSEERMKEVMWQRWRCTVSPMKWDEKQRMWLLMGMHRVGQVVMEITPDFLVPPSWISQKTKTSHDWKRKENQHIWWNKRKKPLVEFIWQWYVSVQLGCFSQCPYFYEVLNILQNKFTRTVKMCTDV